MSHFYALIKPASGSCNMRCRYCFYSDVMNRRETPNYGMMSRETARELIRRAAEQLSAGDEATFAFQGGEPTLAGKQFFRDFFAMASELIPPGVKVNYAFQTNGLVLDDEWCEIFTRHHVLVGLSLDGPASFHDQNRVDANLQPTFRRIMAAKALLEKHNTEYNVLTVLTGNLARHPQEFWSFLCKENISFVQLIPCLDELDCASPSPWALTAQRFCGFYAKLFPLWLKALKQGRYISIRLFDDLVSFYLRGVPSACGINGQCSLQHVVEGDGSVYPCDFYVLDRYRLGCIADDSVPALRQRGQPFLSQSSCASPDPRCKACRYVSSCRGGCRRMRDQVYFEGDTCWYSRLLDEILPPLLTETRKLLGI